MIFSFPWVQRLWVMYGLNFGTFQSLWSSTLYLIRPKRPRSNAFPFCYTLLPALREERRGSFWEGGMIWGCFTVRSLTVQSPKSVWKVFTTSQSIPRCQSEKELLLQRSPLYVAPALRKSFMLLSWIQSSCCFHSGYALWSFYGDSLGQSDLMSPLLGSLSTEPLTIVSSQIKWKHGIQPV